MDAAATAHADIASANVEVIRRIYRAFAENDSATLAALFADDVAMVQVGRNALGGAFQGRQALFGHFASIPSHTEALDMQPYDLLAGAGGHVAALNWMTVRKGGREGRFRVIHLFRIAGGKVAELRSVPEDPYGFDAFMA